MAEAPAGNALVGATVGALHRPELRVLALMADESWAVSKIGGVNAPSHPSAP